MKKDLICIVCPMGCHMTIEDDPNSDLGYKVTGNTCKRGETYAVKEVTNPTRIITSTVKVEGHEAKRLPIKTTDGVPKDKIFDCMKRINEVIVMPPIATGDIIVKDILSTGVDVVASRTLE